MPERPPNILLVLTDQQRADHVGFGGNEVVRTPNLDALAARGTVFDRAIVANPICMPNRSSILTGRVPSAHGCIFNDRSLAWNVNTFPRQLREAGYRTALVGKSHLQHGLSRNVFREAEQAPSSFLTEPEGWDAWENAERYVAGGGDGRNRLRGGPGAAIGAGVLDSGVEERDLDPRHRLVVLIEHGYAQPS